MKKHEIHLRFMEAALTKFADPGYTMQEEAAKRAASQAEEGTIFLYAPSGESYVLREIYD